MTRRLLVEIESELITCGRCRSNDDGRCLMHVDEYGAVQHLDHNPRGGMSRLAECLEAEQRQRALDLGWEK